MMHKKALLREFISEIISEGAASAEWADELGLALCVLKTPRIYVLYDSAKLSELLQGATPNDVSLRGIERNGYDEAIYAMITVKRDYPAWGAAEVMNAAAERGFGPLLYDIVMAAEKGLTSDRHDVSSRAERVWSFYHDNRGDVEAKLLDDIDDPKTPPRKDDAPVFKPDDRDIEDVPLNYAYFMKGPGPDIESLKRRHTSAMKAFKKLGVEQDFMKRIARIFFSKKYREDL